MNSLNSLNCPWFCFCPWIVLEMSLNFEHFKMSLNLQNLASNFLEFLEFYEQKNWLQILFSLKIKTILVSINQCLQFISILLILFFINVQYMIISMDYPYHVEKCFIISNICLKCGIYLVNFFQHKYTFMSYHWTI